MFIAYFLKNTTHNVTNHLYAATYYVHNQKRGNMKKYILFVLIFIMEIFFIKVMFGGDPIISKFGCWGSILGAIAMVLMCGEKYEELYEL